jgi:hypothetical protein
VSDTTVTGFDVVVGAGSRRASADGVWTLPHRWTEAGVTVQTELTGAHVLHLSVAVCVLNDVYREAGPLGVELGGVRVRARGGFDTSTWASTGITYDVEVDSPAPADAVERLLERVDHVAEVPRAIRAGGAVRRAPVPADGEVS